MAARMSAYSVIVWPRVLRTTDSRARMNIFVTNSISFPPYLSPILGTFEATFLVLYCLDPARINHNLNGGLIALPLIVVLLLFPIGPGFRIRDSLPLHVPRRIHSPPHAFTWARGFFEFILFKFRIARIDCASTRKCALPVTGRLSPSPPSEAKES